jgi:hypothetical protein
MVGGVISLENDWRGFRLLLNLKGAPASFRRPGVDNLVRKIRRRGAAAFGATRVYHLVYRTAVSRKPK